MMLTKSQRTHIKSVCTQNSRHHDCTVLMWVKQRENYMSEFESWTKILLECGKQTI